VLARWLVTRLVYGREDRDIQIGVSNVFFGSWVRRTDSRSPIASVFLIPVLTDHSQEPLEPGVAMEGVMSRRETS
jgi:hypothetical protein